MLRGARLSLPFVRRVPRPSSLRARSSLAEPRPQREQEAEAPRYGPSFTASQTRLSILPEDIDGMRTATHQQERAAPLTNASVRRRRSELFDQERQRQLDLLPRVDKISVNYVGAPKDAMLSMNKHISTPYNVAQRMLAMP